MVFSKESGTKTGVTVSDKYQIQLKKSILIKKNLKQFYDMFIMKFTYQMRCCNFLVVEIVVESVNLIQMS